VTTDLRLFSSSSFFSSSGMGTRASRPRAARKVTTSTMRMADRSQKPSRMAAKMGARIIEVAWAIMIIELALA